MTNAQHEPARRRDARFRVRTEGVVDWLATATDSMGGRFADTYGPVDHTFRRGGEDMHDRIQVLIDRAQSDGALSAPDHLILVWQVADEGFLLTIDPPSPPRLCSPHLCVEDLVSDKTSGSVAAVAVLMAIGQVANQLLKEQSQARAAAGSTAPTAFPGIHQHRPTDPPRATPPDANPADPGGPRRPHHGR